MILSICLAVGLGCAGILGAGPASEPVSLWSRPPRSIEIGSRTACTLSVGQVSIVTAVDAPSTVRFAAAELRTFLSQILGGEISVVHALPSGGACLVLGMNQWSRQVGLAEEKLVRDGFYIRTAGNRIYIAGRDDSRADADRALQRGGARGQLYERGTLFGVYDFLERVAGVRMYFPGELGTVVPRRQKLAVPEMNIFDRPDFTLRHYSTYWDGTYFEGEKPDVQINPRKSLNYYRLRMQTEHIPCCHGTCFFHYMERIGNSHPEYFALLSNGARSNDPRGVHFPGQLCWSSGIVEEIYRDASAYLKGEKRDVSRLKFKRHPWGMNCYGGKYVDIMPQDAFQACHCPACQAAYNKKERNYAADLIWGKTAWIAAQLKKNGIPGYLTQMSYPPYNRVPAVEIPDNVLVMVAERGPWQEVNPEQQNAADRNIEAWTRKLGHKVWLWNYIHKGGSLKMPGVPQLAPHAIGAYYRKQAPYIFGAFAESESDRFLFNYLNYYVFAKIAWNSRTDYKALLEEHYRLMFGSAQTELKQFYERLENIWTRRIAGRTVDTDLGPVGAPPSDYDLWNDIYSGAVLAELDGLLTRGAAKVAKNSLEAGRIGLIRREYYRPLTDARRAYMDRTQAVKGLKVHIQDKPGRQIHLRPFKRGKVGETVETSVQIWRTAEDFGVLFHCREPKPDQVLARKRQPDDREMWKDDSVEVFLNPTGDRRVYYQLMVNSLGSVSDQKLIRHGKAASGDYGWNSQARVEVTKTDDGADIRILIPLRNLPGIKEEFPVNFARNRMLKQSGSYQVFYIWSPFAGGYHDVENFGSVTMAPDRNLLINGDFSMRPTISRRHFGLWEKYKWLGGWIGLTAEAQKLDDAVFVSGPCSMRMDCDGTRKVIAVHNLPLKPGVRYRLSFYVKLADVRSSGKGNYGGIGVYANLWDDHNRWFPKGNALTGSMDWHYQAFEFTAGPKTNISTKCYLRLGYANVLGTVWFDDVRLEEVE